MVKGKIIVLIWLLIVSISLSSLGQKVKGEIEILEKSSNLSSIKLLLYRHQGKHLIPCDTAKVDGKGHFVLTYPSGYHGMGMVQVMGMQGEITLVLGGGIQQSLVISKEGLTTFPKNSPNAIYETYNFKMRSNIAKLDHLKILGNYYDSTNAFRRSLNEELQKGQLEYQQLLKEIDTLDEDAGYFLRLGESLNAMSILLGANQRPSTTMIENAQKRFESIVNLSDERLLNSGIMHRLVHNYYSLSSALVGGHQHASDFLAKSLADSPYKNTYIEEIISVLLSAPPLAEYFSQRMLAISNLCDDIQGNDMPNKIKRQLEQYSLLRIGSEAPDELLQNGKRISELPAAYKLIVFWASWCEHCQKEIPELQAMYGDLKKQDVEVVAMGMDDNAQIHSIVSQTHPWVSHFLGRDWNAPVTQNYRVFGTPTYFLVDKDMKIIARPKSVAEVAQWINRNKI